MSYGFQNPNTGYPFLLLEVYDHDADDVHMRVEPEDFDVPPSQDDIADSRTYTRAVMNCADIHEAARILRRDFGANDIDD